jgi:toxin HigB-1
VIRSFGDSRTQQLWLTGKSKRFPPNLIQSALRKLLLINVATRLDDLRVPPGNRLEALKADRAGQFSIQVNDQYRICFAWSNGDAFDVEIIDYHGSISLLEDKQMPTRKDAVPTWNIHPGEILREEFLKPMGLSANELAKSIHVPAPRINDIVLERRGITADTAVRLARFFNMSEEFWMNLQLQYEIRAALQRLRKTIRKIQPRRARRAA